VILAPWVAAKLAVFPWECHIIHRFLLSSALVALSQSHAMSHQPAGGTVDGDSALVWETRSKNWPRVVTVTGWEGNDLVPPFPQASRQTYTCVSTLLPLCVMQQIKYGSPNLCATKIRGVVAKIWWDLERGAGHGCLAPPQIVKVFSVFGQVHCHCAVGWKVVALLGTLTVQPVGICWLQQVCFEPWWW